MKATLTETRPGWKGGQQQPTMLQPGTRITIIGIGDFETGRMKANSDDGYYLTITADQATPDEI